VLTFDPERPGQAVLVRDGDVTIEVTDGAASASRACLVRRGKLFDLQSESFAPTYPARVEIPFPGFAAGPDIDYPESSCLTLACDPPDLLSIEGGFPRPALRALRAGSGVVRLEAQGFPRATVAVHVGEPDPRLGLAFDPVNTTLQVDVSSERVRVNLLRDGEAVEWPEDSTVDGRNAVQFTAAGDIRLQAAGPDTVDVSPVRRGQGTLIAKWCNLEATLDFTVVDQGDPGAINFC
jgi:hypothetical protein